MISASAAKYFTRDLLRPFSQHQRSNIEQTQPDIESACVGLLYGSCTRRPLKMRHLDHRSILVHRILATFFVGTLCSAVMLMGGCRDGSDTPSVKSTGDRPEVVATDFNRKLSTAMKAVKSGDLDQAEELLRPILVSDPNHAQALFLFAQVQASRGNMGDAINTLSAISADDAEAAMAALGQSADWLIELGRYEEAASKLTTLIRKSGDIPRAHRRLAQLFNNLGLRMRAATHMRTLARMGHASESELYGMTTFSDPFIHRPEMPGYSEIKPTDLGQAKFLWYDGQHNEARQLLEDLQIKSPKSTPIAAFAGRVFVHRQDDAEVLKWLASTPSGIEQEPEYWAAIGNWNQQQEKHEIAIRCLTEAVLRDDTDRHSFLALARSLKAIGRTADAARVMERYRLLDRVAFIASEINRTSEQMLQVVQLLVKLRRTAEARAWNKLAQRSAQQINISELPEIGHDEHWASCGLNKSDWPLPDFSRLGARPSIPEKKEFQRGEDIVLTNVAELAELNMEYMPGPPGTNLNQLLMHQTIGGGIATLDYDLDGWPDLHFTQGSGTPFENSGSESDQLFRNYQGEAFSKVAQNAGIAHRGFGQGATSADLNQDGFPDLVIANIGRNIIYINNGDGTFSDLDQESMRSDNRWTTSIACGDLTGDNLPDLVEINYINDATVLTAKCSIPGGNGHCNPQRFRAATDQLLCNTADGKLVPLLTSDPIPPGYGFSALITNIDNQFGNDLFIANDTDPNHFWQSQKTENSDHRFRLTQRATLLGCASGLLGNPESCMGVATGDFDRNGALDFHVTNYTEESSDLYLQKKSGIFSNDFIRLGLEPATAPMVGWGTQASDLNSDGWLDLVILNGHLYSALSDGTPYRMPPQIFSGSPSGFSLATTESSHDSFWTTDALGRTLATLDWNADGKMDLVAYNMDMPVALLENQSATGNWLQLELIGTTSERDAVGAKVSVECSGENWNRWVTSGDGFQCKNEPLLHIGLGRSTAPCHVEVTWPSGNKQTYDNIDPNQRYLMIEGNANLHTR
jgi:predicted Zn-dependent protease